MNKKALQIVAYSKLLELDEGSMRKYAAFIDEASEAELKMFIMDGEIFSVDRITEQIVNDRFNNFIHVTELKTALKVGAVLAALVGAKRLLQKKVQAASYACDDYTGMEKKLCMARMKNKAFEEQLGRINSMAGKCDQTQNPEQCRRLMDAAKASVQHKIEQNKAQMSAKDIEPYMQK
jgi:hypothetical protein